MEAIKRLLSMVLVFVFVQCGQTVIFAIEEKDVVAPCMRMENNELLEFSVYSEEFPDAYIAIDDLRAIPNYLKKEKCIDYSANLSVYVMEEHRVVDGVDMVIDSKLLSREEVEKIEFSDYEKKKDENNRSDYDYQSYQKLWMTLSGSYSQSGSGVTVSLYGHAHWTGYSSLPGIANPAAGKDYLGMTWFGAYSCSSSSCTTLWSTGSTSNGTLVASSPNSGRVYSFYDVGNSLNSVYTTDVYLNLELYKNVLNGGGNTAEVAMQYIHTYQTVTGSISFNPSGLGYSLSNTPSQWSLSCTVNGFPY